MTAVMLVGTGIAALVVGHYVREDIHKAALYGLSIGLCLSGMVTSVVGAR